MPRHYIPFHLSEKESHYFWVLSGMVVTHAKKNTSRLCTASVLCLDLIVHLVDAIIQCKRISFLLNFFFSLCDTALCRVTYVWKPEGMYAVQCLPRPR
uniref:Uncharacterized protein n=1 Tax=Rhipicephalus zambeziensis TaxID=60191 RepID=A0A224YEW5_9ACAR